MDTIVKALNAKVQNGDAKTIVEALKQIDPNAEGDTVAEVIENMELGGGGGGGTSFPYLTVELTNTSTEYYLENYGSALSSQFFVEDSGKLTLTDVPSIEASSTQILKYLYYDVEDEVFVNITDESRLIVASSDAVNCVLNGGSVTITDKTIPASIKISMEGGR